MGLSIVSMKSMVFPFGVGVVSSAKTLTSNKWSGT